MKQIVFFGSLGLLFFTACNPSGNGYDASGVFEAEEVIVSAEAGGRILKLNADEGTVLKAGEVIGSIDCTTLELQKQEVKARLAALKAKTNSAAPQVAIYQQQILAQNDQIDVLKARSHNLEKEQQRFRQLVKAEAVPEKQLDDLAAELDVLQKQIQAANSQKSVLEQQIESYQRQVAIQNRGILSETEPLEAKLAQLDYQISKCQLVNPVAGTVISSFAEAGEFTATGKALYKIANLDEIILRAYLTGEQLSQVKINQNVKILTPGNTKNSESLSGVITWIADKAEFTPKTIQTKEERAHLVYATRIKVKNDGKLKIGMYADVLFK